MRLAVAALLLSPLMLSACGPTCAETCRRYIAEDECDAGPSGKPIEEAIEGCVQQCNRAILTPGPAPTATDGRFNPNVATPTNIPGEDVLRNDLEAAAWMDCVYSFADLAECRVELGKQACAPVF